jgi:hypothetical protein
MMGLDTYAANGIGEELTPKQVQAFQEADIQLCGGMFSGGEGSFRGKVYDRLIQEVTGESLYQHWIPPETVKKMSRDLNECDPEQVISGLDVLSPPTPFEVRQLRTFFQICAEHDLGLQGWW